MPRRGHAQRSSFVSPFAPERASETSLCQSPVPGLLPFTIPLTSPRCCPFPLPSASPPHLSPGARAPSFPTNHLTVWPDDFSFSAREFALRCQPALGVFPHHHGQTWNHPSAFSEHTNRAMCLGMLWGTQPVFLKHRGKIRCPPVKSLISYSLTLEIPLPPFFRGSQKWLHLGIRGQNDSC